MFLTITVNPARGIDANQRARRLKDAFAKWVRMVRAEHGKTACEYFYVFEAQASGEPHLHVVGRWPRIEKEDISAFFEKELDAPSTRIEGIKSQDGLAKYLSKYLTKGPTRFGSLKRYGYSRSYFIKARPDQYIAEAWRGSWDIVDRPWHDLRCLYWFKGFRRAAEARPGFIELHKPQPPPAPRPFWGDGTLTACTQEWVRP